VTEAAGGTGPEAWTSTSSRLVNLKVEARGPGNTGRGTTSSSTSQTGHLKHRGADTGSGLGGGAQEAGGQWKGAPRGHGEARARRPWADSDSISISQRRAREVPVPVGGSEWRRQRLTPRGPHPRSGAAPPLPPPHANAVQEPLTAQASAGGANLNSCIESVWRSRHTLYVSVT